MNKEILIIELEKIGIKITDFQMTQIEEYCRFLLSENQKHNLTAIRTIEEVYLKHIYDSLTLIHVIDLKEIETLLDIGSGAGFPGIVLKIIFPHLKVTLLDANGKKCKFLDSVKDLLNLENLTVIHDRAENYINQSRDTFDMVTARAVANLNVLLELAIPFLKVGGKFIAMKAKIEEELKNCNDVCTILNSNIDQVFSLNLPIEYSQRTLVVIKKVEKTPNIYPRAYDKIMKKPLKINKK